MEQTSAFWIEKLCLQKHPEGGYFKEAYRSDESISHLSLPFRFKEDRCFSTAIYFLLENDNFSAFHRIKSDEIWHFYKGSSLTLYIITEDGCLSNLQLGDNPLNGEHFQITVARNSWFAAHVNAKSSFTLLGCTVAPGFDFKDFELADCEDLCKEYPQYETLIKKLTINQ
ncbi:MAG: cupin domain-containing protein [Bacteroidota bacterium]